MSVRIAHKSPTYFGRISVGNCVWTPCNDGSRWREEPRLKRLRLTGERFEGGRLPVDSLIEIQRYQDVIRKVAEYKWLQDHPDQELPTVKTSRDSSHDTGHARGVTAWIFSITPSSRTATTAMS